MKKLNDIFFSMLTSVILLLIFAVSIAFATFAESKSGIEFARSIVYNAKWFEILLAIMVLNLLGNAVRYKIFNKRKFTILLFHLAFICMLVGAAVTRYFGYEGTMHIREGETTNEISSDKTSVGITAEYKGEKAEKITRASFSANSSASYSEKLRIAGKKIIVEKESFIPNATETIVRDEQGEPALSLLVMNQESLEMNLILLNGETYKFDDITFAFNSSVQTTDIAFSIINNRLCFKSTLPVYSMGMQEKTESKIKSGVSSIVEPKAIYKIGNVVFELKSFLPRGTKKLIRMTADENETGMERHGKNAIIFNVSDGNTTKQVNVFCSKNEKPQPATCQLNDVKVSVSYGMLQHKLPFSITLRDFKLDRYPGSNSPSSYASEITVTDNESKAGQPYKIFMNNILNYRGYRFFQASYDPDEKGTILSVSQDYWGTFITYTGYLLMMAGMILTLFNRNSRFRTVLRLSSELQKKRKAGKAIILVGLLVLSGSALASGTGATKKEHVAALNSLLIQDEVQGRIEPFSTFASDVLRKISKQTTYNKMPAVEVLLGMSANPSSWQNEPIIKVANPQLAKEIGAVNDYVSFNQLFDTDNGETYRLKDLIDKVYQKERSTQNKYDKEVINVDERANICYQIFNGNMLALFPVPVHKTNKWSTAKPDTTESGQSQVISATNSPEIMLQNYFSSVNKATMSGNWQIANKALGRIKNYQVMNGGNNLPSDGKVKLEIFYNEVNIFGKLSFTYAILGFLLLILHLIDIFKRNSRLEKYLNLSIFPFLLVFFFYTAGLAIRWYISDHAPWSNGYETMIFVGWAASLSGLLFARKSPISLAVTGVLSGITLFVAGMSWMNPEITNLVPVLKSYWLIIHVAVITSSYGFLAMGALLGMLNMILMIARSKKNMARLNDSIQEISYTIELALIVGLILLSIGCFIGGVWANESWGTYWSWDPKETWALVSILVYAAILHLRNVPKANNQFVLSSLALVGFSTIIMTFFGVNYYLSGMHSYAQGTPPSIPKGVYVIIVLIVVLIFGAYKSEKKNNL